MVARVRTEGSPDVRCSETESSPLHILDYGFYESEYGAPAVYAALPEGIRKLADMAEIQKDTSERDENGRDGRG
jgi:hypothetical protein